MRLWEKIIDKFVLYTTIFVGIGVFFLVWGIGYESSGGVNIKTIMKREDLTLLYIFQQNPYGLLLGWIPAYVVSVFLLLFISGLLAWAIPVVRLLYPVFILYGLFFWA